jgi:hypothetical protein
LKTAFQCVEPDSAPLTRATMSAARAGKPKGLIVLTPNR